MNIVQQLPTELQNRVFYYYAEHPCAVLVKEWYHRCFGMWAHYEYKSGNYRTMEELEEGFREDGFFHGGRRMRKTLRFIPVNE